MERRAPRISIHAPRVGGDSVRHFTLPGFHYFNPRPPCGGRQTSLNNSSRCVEFQSTPPVWGATHLPFCYPAALDISIHAPRVGGDRDAKLFWSALSISIHAPRVGGDQDVPQGVPVVVISIHAPRVGGDNEVLHLFIPLGISIHAPRVGGDKTLLIYTRS